jgi:hypothetical protein
MLGDGRQLRRRVPLSKASHIAYVVQRYFEDDLDYVHLDLD